jgi:predicted enzyme related to lactoylglutathione lyase
MNFFAALSIRAWVVRPVGVTPRRTKMTFPTGRFVWFEYAATDTAKAQGFFGELFGWKTQQMPSPDGKAAYTMIAVGDQSIGGYVPMKPEKAHWLAHLQVANTEATAKQITSLGGKVVHGPTKMGEIGTYAVVADPFGAAFALWQPGKPEASDWKDQVGAFCWNELITPDPEKAVAFYKKIGGFASDSKMEMPGMGAYHVLETDGKPRAGVLKPPMPEAPLGWIPYVHVASADQSVAKAQKLGAQAFPAKDIPNVGRFSIVKDPQGAHLGILQPSK